jgi:acetolactate synthase small subunit
MPTSKELTIRMEDQPGILGRCCKSLAARGVNILAFQAVPFGREQRGSHGGGQPSNRKGSTG